MRLKIKATRSSLARLVRAKGYDLPSIRQAVFASVGKGRVYWINWNDSAGKRCYAYYSASGGQPTLQVDTDWIDLTLAEVIHFGLVEEEKEKAPDAAATTSRGRGENSPQTHLYCTTTPDDLQGGNSHD